MANQNYNWRPNDNSATTRIKYDLEAEHWFRSFEEAKYKYRKRSISADLKVVGMFLELILSLLFLIGIMAVGVFKWLRSL